MITDSQTNLVYFSEKLAADFPEEYDRIISILDKHDVSHALLKETKDIWCRDYLPIQVDKDNFVGFRYEPSYHKKPEDIAKQSDPKAVCKANGIPARFSSINLDGGNVVRYSDRVMITDRVFDENNDIPRTELVDQLEKLFKAEVIIIPQIKCDMTGHADGLVRFIDQNTILVNEIDREYAYWQKGINRVIATYNFNIKEIPWLDPKTKKSISAVGCYINFLEVGNLILLPEFRVEGNRDEEAKTLIQSIYKDRIVETVEINRIAEEGGVLNCISWNIMRINSL